jgi:hypothetical protein
MAALVVSNIMHARALGWSANSDYYNPKHGTIHDVPLARAEAEQRLTNSLATEALVARQTADREATERELARTAASLATNATAAHTSLSKLLAQHAAKKGTPTEEEIATRQEHIAELQVKIDAAEAAKQRHTVTAQTTLAELETAAATERIAFQKKREVDTLLALVDLRTAQFQAQQRNQAIQNARNQFMIDGNRQHLEDTIYMILDGSGPPSSW